MYKVFPGSNEFYNIDSINMDYMRFSMLLLRDFNKIMWIISL